MSDHPSLHDRIGAQAASYPTLPSPRPKPGELQQQKPKHPRSATTASTPVTRTSAGAGNSMSASDASEGIKQGAGLKELMAALQGKVAFATSAEPPVAPASAPKPKRKPPQANARMAKLGGARVGPPLGMLAAKKSPPAPPSLSKFETVLEPMAPAEEIASPPLISSAQSHSKSPLPSRSVFAVPRKTEPLGRKPPRPPVSSAPTTPAPDVHMPGVGVAAEKQEGGVTPDRAIQKASPTASRPQSVYRRADAQSKKAGSQESLLTNRGGYDPKTEAEARVNTYNSTPIEPLTANEPSSITMLQGAKNFNISNANFTAITGNATIIRFGDAQFTDIQRHSIGNYIATLTALPGINDNMKKHWIQSIINLPRAEAVFNDYQIKKKNGPCFEGTRIVLLREMTDWVTGQDESRMYILSGLAGIGKSTIAYTIASRAADLNLLGASFFFSRDEADRSNAKKLFTTIAYQLCVYNEQFSKVIGDALRTERGSAAPTKDVYEQLRVLILDPLRSILQSRARPILVVVDALDECNGDDVQAVIHGLSQLVQDLPSFKVILTTRPQPLFDHHLSNEGSRKLFRLQDIEDKIVDDDIRLYLQYKLSLKAVQEHYPRLQWCASDGEIDTLVCAAGRLFIIASTTVRYILDKSASNPASQMQKLVGADAQICTLFKDLNQFYMIILRNVVPVDCDNYETINRYQSVVGAIILIQQPLPVSVLARLLDINMEEIRVILDHLQSVILLSDDDVPRVYHKSFPDYLMDKARCKDSHVQIDAKIHHTQIVIRCFKIANSHLKYNILGLGTPARFMDNEDGLKKDGITKEQVEEKIPQQLCYACIFWVTHLNCADIENSTVMKGLNKFVNKHALHWLEVLSLIGKLDRAHHAIRIVLDLLKSTCSNLHELLSDMLRFVSKFYDIINRSALHTYYSALPFSPTDSLLYCQYTKEAGRGICNIEGGPTKWNAIITDMNHEKPVICVKFSLDSTMVVSFSERDYLDEDRLAKLKICDAFTGTPISTFLGHEFAISNDFAAVASSKDNLITCYYLNGSPSGTRITTSSATSNLALSSESNRIAAGLFNGSICLWKSTNGELIDSFYGGVPRFSPSGTRLVCSLSRYSRRNDVVELRDGISGKFIADLQCGNNACLEFSANSSRIASLSHDHGLTLWSSKSGDLIAAAHISGNTLIMAISKNGSLLAAPDYDGIALWSENCGQLTKIDVLEFESTLYSVAFSPDNLLAICEKRDIKIYNIETRTMSTLISIPYRVIELTFSPDGSRLAAGKHLLDPHAINTSSPSFRETAPQVVTLSRDCSRLACGFDDGRVELWGTSPPMRRISSRMAHRYPITAIAFALDGRLFASGSESRTIKLWNSGDGSLHGTLELVAFGACRVAFSHSVLIAGKNDQVAVWDLGTLSHIKTFKIRVHDVLSISDDGNLVALISHRYGIDIVDLTNHTTTHIAIPKFWPVKSMAFLPDKSHLVGQSEHGKFQSLDLVNRCIANEHLVEHLIQLPGTPLWRGVPLCVHSRYENYGQIEPTTLYSPLSSSVRLLWVPTEHVVRSWALGSSMIVLCCKDGRLILLRPS